MSESDNKDVEDVIRILIATDNHLGYGENDPIRGEDSFTAFEEILQKAVEEDVDLILLGGDLFHDAVPSQNALHKCMKLLRKYTFGDKPVSLEFLSDQRLNFHNTISEKVNYEDPNLNISIPVFSIHGNHDDPSGLGRISSLDLLATTGLVNYFGRWTDLNEVNVSPLLLRKGESQLAIYGLSHIHDGRLARLFENYKVSIESPTDETGEWFHLMVIHQNRADRGPKNYIPEELLPDFLHFVLWGHEHDCRIEPERNANRDFWVCQPGSSIPTSLAKGEALKKHVGLLEIYKTKFRLKPLPLETVRPFVFESINLIDIREELRLDEGDESNKVKAMAEERVEFLIEKAKEMVTGNPKQPSLPLIRLRILYATEDQMFNAIRFGQTFNGRVANPADIIGFKKLAKIKTKNESIQVDKTAMNAVFQKQDIDANTKVEDLVCKYFNEVKSKKPLHVLPAKALSEMSYRLVERRDNNAADNIIKFYKNNGIKHLMENLPTGDTIKETLIWFKDQIPQEDLLQSLDNKSNIDPISIKSSKQQRKNKEEEENLEVSSSSKSSTHVEDSTVIKTSSRGRGRGRSAVTRGRGTKAPHSMPELNVSVKSSRSTRGDTILSSFSKDARSKRGINAPVFEISDESD